jgi:hypothetical protein
MKEETLQHWIRVGEKIIKDYCEQLLPQNVYYPVYIKLF